MATIYEQFDTHFAKVAAWAILHDGQVIGRAACKYPADGMGRCYFYLQVWGAPMVRGTAAGCGYDKTTAAAYNAAKALADVADDATGNAPQYIAAIVAALNSDGGYRWTRQLESGGFTVQHVLD